MRTTFALLFFFVAGRTALAGEFWKEIPWTQWSQEQAVALLNQSPWASTERWDKARPRDPSTFRRVGPACCDDNPPVEETQLPPATGSGGVSGGTSGGFFAVRFFSALPVRMALARLAVLSGELAESQAQQAIDGESFPGHAVVALFAAPGQDISVLVPLSSDEALEGVYLEMPKSKQRIHPLRVITPQQAGGPQAFFLFPRVSGGQEIPPAGERKIRFVCHLGPGLKIEKSFTLKKMWFQGRLEL